MRSVVPIMTEGVLTVMRHASYNRTCSLEHKFGRLPEREDLQKVVGQVDAAANLFAGYFKDAPVERFVRLCAASGVCIKARSKEGAIVADEFRMLLAHK